MTIEDAQDRVMQELNALVKSANGKGEVAQTITPLEPYQTVAQAPPELEVPADGEADASAIEEQAELEATATEEAALHLLTAMQNHYEQARVIADEIRDKAKARANAVRKLSALSHTYRQRAADNFDFFRKGLTGPEGQK